MIHRFPFAFILSGYAAWKITVTDLLHHRFMTVMLAVGISLCGGTAAYAVWFVWTVLIQSIIPITIGTAWTWALMLLVFVVFSGWGALYLQAKNPMMSTFLWGGELLIVQYSGDDHITVMARDVLPDPSRSAKVVEASIPGIFFFRKPTLGKWMGWQRYTVQWTMEGIERALARRPLEKHETTP